MPILSPISYKIEVKKAIVEALRLVFNTDYPDPYGVIDNNLLISLDYPNKPEQYPAIFVDFHERELHSIGISHLEYENDGAEVRKRFWFRGTVTLTIFATKSLARDFISDNLVHLLAFGPTTYTTNEFIPYLTNNPQVDIQIGSDSLIPGGDNVQSGVSWGFQDERIYTSSYSFEIVGSFASQIVHHPYIRGVNEFPEVI